MTVSRNGKRRSMRTTVTALVIAAAASCVGGAAAGDCAPGMIDVGIEDRPLTRAQRIARLDQALDESLARFDECQNATAAVAGGRDGGAERTAGDGGSDGSGAMEGARDARTPASGQPTTTGAAMESGPMESVPAEGVEGTDAPEEAERPRSARERTPSSGSGSGMVPDDIPEPDNDSVLEAQIRRAAMEETDPKIRAELWNEYRKYKGLPAKPLPEDDGEQTDA